MGCNSSKQLDATTTARAPAGDPTAAQYGSGKPAVGHIEGASATKGTTFTTTTKATAVDISSEYSFDKPDEAHQALPTAGAVVHPTAAAPTRTAAVPTRTAAVPTRVGDGRPRSMPGVGATAVPARAFNSLLVKTRNKPTAQAKQRALGRELQRKYRAEQELLLQEQRNATGGGLGDMNAFKRVSTNFSSCDTIDAHLHDHNIFAVGRNTADAVIGKRALRTGCNRRGGAGVVSSSGNLTPLSSVVANSIKTTSRVKTNATLLENYDLTKDVLGTGISGQVCLAVHRETGKLYAIKTLSLKGVSEKKALFLHNEVSIYLRLDHPNIAKLFEVYEEEGAIHLVMEYCAGGELYDRLAKCKRYSERVAARVTTQMLEALNYCHVHRICHRDLKLENWVYCGTGADDALKLIDFGFSRIYNPGVPMTAVHGTVYYVSPEVMDGMYGEKCDVWSIGVIVYMLLSGTPPFNGAQDSDILVKIKRAEYSYEGPRWRGVSEEAKRFIAALLVKDPAKRLSAAQALRHPWLGYHESFLDHELDIGILQQMRQFALGNALKRAALGLLSLNMTPEEAHAIDLQFKLLDRNNSGTITLNEMVHVLVENLNLTALEAQHVFDRVDQSGDLEVHYSEFMASTFCCKLLQSSESSVKDAFRMFDLDTKGYITLDDLRTVLGDSYMGVKVEDIMRGADMKGNNVIDYDEFLVSLMGEEEDNTHEFVRSPTATFGELAEYATSQSSWYMLAEARRSNQTMQSSELL